MENLRRFSKNYGIKQIQFPKENFYDYPNSLLNSFYFNTSVHIIIFELFCLNEENLVNFLENFNIIAKNLAGNILEYHEILKKI